MNAELERIRQNLRNERLSWVDVATLEAMARDGQIPEYDAEMLGAAGIHDDLERADLSELVTITEQTLDDLESANFFGDSDAEAREIRPLWVAAFNRPIPCTLTRDEWDLAATVALEGAIHASIHGEG